MRTYLVGGAVRDKIMGVKPKDRDYVVVGASPQDMANLGYKQVGADFPVFLHPDTGDEYALARTENKLGSGYLGFSCDFSKSVTLEEDLKRRDLTINSIAMDLDTRVIIDPFNGQQDIEDKVLRATSEAFKEDPVRALRLARFKARFGIGWSIDSLTESYCREVVKLELSGVSAERIFLELQKALAEPHPHLFFQTLCVSMGEDHWFKEVKAAIGVPQSTGCHPEGDVWNHQIICLQRGVDMNLPPKLMFAVLCHDFGKAVSYDYFGNLRGYQGLCVTTVDSFCDQLKVPSDWRELAVKVCTWHSEVHNALKLSPKKVHGLFKATDSIRKTDMLPNLTACCKAIARGKAGCGGIPYYQGEYLESCLSALEFVCRKDIAMDAEFRGLPSSAIGANIRLEEINVIKGVKKAWQKN